MKPDGLLTILLLSCLAASPLGAQETAQAEIDAINKESGLDLTADETDNFIWALGIPAGKARPIQQAAERAFAVWKEISGIQDYEPMWGRRKALMAVLRDRTEYRKFVGWFGKRYKPYDGFENTAGNVSYWPQPVPRVTGMIHLKPLSYQNLENAAAHVVGHLVAMRQDYNNNFLPPWFEEGMGSYLEVRATRRGNCYCFTGGYANRAKQMEKLTNISWPDWKGLVANMVRGREDKAMRLIIPMALDELSAEEMGKAWSVIDYMVTENPGKFIKFIGEMKSRWPSAIVFGNTEGKEKAQAEALQHIWGLTWDELDAKWRDYVRAKYRPPPK